MSKKVFDQNRARGGERRRTAYLFLLLLCATLPWSLRAQNLSISGTVRDGNSDPVAGANVVVKGSTVGVITDADGSYAITAPASATLVFSFLGLTTREEVVAGRGRIDVVLSESDQVLDEMVVVGYGVQKKSVVTAAISRITADDLNIANPSRVEDVLKGKVSGVQITQSSGHPGAASQVRIRGIGTINNSNPLYIVDGMAVDGGIDYLNPVDIQSVEILKDAASGAIYGARAANGVVLVTTKTGQPGKTALNYDFSFGWQNPWKKMDMLNAEEYMTVMNEASLNDGYGLKYTKDDMSRVKSEGLDTDWQAETFYRNAPVQNHQVSASGGSEKISYFASFGYFSQDGIVGGSYDKSNYDRWSLRTNAKYSVFETNTRTFLNKIALGVNAGYSRTVVAGTEPNEQYNSVLINALSASPLMTVYADDARAAEILAGNPFAVKDADGRVFDFPESGHQLVNPLGMLNQPARRTDNSDKFVASLFAELDVLPGLKFKSSFGADLSFWGFDAYNYRLQLGGDGTKDKKESAVESQLNRGFRRQLENVLTYACAFAEKHNLSVVLGQSAQQYRYRYLYGTKKNLTDETDPLKATIDNTTPAILLTDVGVAGGIGSVDYSALASYFGRVDYNYDERYMLEATLRRDGSSRFGPNNKWALFPAVSAGWNVWNEPFLQGYKPPWLTTLKLRFSWGKNGNESIPDLSYTAFIQPGADYYFGQGYSVASGSETPVQSGLEAAKIANPSVRWEESEQADVGVDARFLGNALSLSFDYFSKKTNGMLIGRPIPDYVGLASPYANVGDMENRGCELEIGWKHSISQFRYYASLNASYIHNTLVNAGTETGHIELSVTSQATGAVSFVRGSNGEPYPYFYGYVTDGIFQTADEVKSYAGADGKPMQPAAKPGDVRFKDLNSDGKIDDLDRTKIGKGTPDWTFGCSLGADWKGVDANLFFQGVAGNNMFDLTQRSDLVTANRPAWTLDRWAKENSGNRLPRLTNEDPNNNRRPSDLYVKDGAYLRLKNIQLGYTLPQKWTKTLAIAKLRIFVMAENLLTLTAYDGFDPEAATGDYFNIGVDRGVYPQSKTFSIGANISF
ncbi:MAG: TonB-dependent receptor [Prevotellaceae bacterium]|jgi:TonB-linked SusC/RagA family outer membrane protein|nr:TonB-dependent receptor [Prevotellaceae bacterium]